MEKTATAELNRISSAMSEQLSEIEKQMKAMKRKGHSVESIRPVQEAWYLLDDVREKIWILANREGQTE